LLLRSLALVAAGQAASDGRSHEQKSAALAAFSRFRAHGAGGGIARSEIPGFLRLVLASMSSASFAAGLQKETFSVEDILRGTEGLLPPSRPAQEELDEGRGWL
ncbi:MAG: hypothetical protein SGPRY_013743, partial [Prymnesium sp.]